ncbi:MAG TPA: hypothetical protein VGI65_02515 [Steroidobacteraceae bacterium]
MTRGIGFAALFGLLLCAVILIVPGCGGKPPTREQAIERYSQALREGVSSHVPDEQRRAQMLSIVDQLEAVHVRFNQETADFIASYDKLNADYDATRPAFDQLFSDYSAKRVKARGQALDLHFQLASLATAAEWDTIGRAETKLYEKVNAARPANQSAK